MIMTGKATFMTIFDPYISYTLVRVIWILVIFNIQDLAFLFW